MLETDSGRLSFSSLPRMQTYGSGCSLQSSRHVDRRFLGNLDLMILSGKLSFFVSGHGCSRFQDELRTDLCWAQYIQCLCNNVHSQISYFGFSVLLYMTQRANHIYSMIQVTSNSILFQKLPFLSKVKSPLASGCSQSIIDTGTSRPCVQFLVLVFSMVNREQSLENPGIASVWLHNCRVRL